MSKNKFFKSLGLTLILVSNSSWSALITSAPTGGTTTVLTSLSGSYATAPSTTAGGFNISAPGGSSVWYGDTYYGLIWNGNWQNFAWVGGECYSGSCTATIDLGGLYSSVGGFMNYGMSDANNPDRGSGGNPTISALAADGTTVLESYDLFTLAPITTASGVNAGAFRGISRSNADIAFFRISGSYLIQHDITLTNVPLPAAWQLLMIGFGGIAAISRRKSLSA